MKTEIVSMKLHELDETLYQLHQRMEQTTVWNEKQMEQTIQMLRKECLQTKERLKRQLSNSRADILQEVFRTYCQIERIVNQFCNTLHTNMLEERILLAEYSLDFAIQAANEALLLSLEVIQEQIEEKDVKE